MLQDTSVTSLLCKLRRVLDFIYLASGALAAVFLFSILFFEKFGSERKLLDGFNDATPIGDFAWHRFVY